MPNEENPLEELENEPTTAVVEGENAPKVEEDKPEEDKAKAKRRLSDRNREITRNWREEQRKNEALEKRLAELEESNKLKAEPDVNDYDDVDKFKQDNAKWVAQEREKIRAEERQAIRKEEEENRNRKRINEAEEIFAKTSREYLGKDVNYKGYIKEIQEVCEDYRTPDIQELIIEAKETGPEVITYLGKNPDKLEEIASLSPARRIAKINRLIGRLEAKPVKKSSSAPDPARSVAGSAPRPNARSKYQAGPRPGESFKEYAARRNGR